MDCPLQLNADGFFECPDCRWVYKRRAEKPPHRTCPKSPSLNSPEHRARIKAKMLAELEPIFKRRPCPSCDKSRAAEQIDKCFACEQFDGRVCTARGPECKVWKGWFVFLALMTEPCWLFSPESVDGSHVT